MGSFTKFRISAAACIALALMLLVLPLWWILAWAVAAAFHECCHLLAVKLCGGTVHRLTMGPDGARMEISGISGGKELICALAGPLGALLLLLAARWISATAVCAAFQSAYNLLPLYPMDGGRALCSLLEILIPRRASGVCRWVTRITLIFLWIGAAYAAIFLKLGLIPLVFALILWMKTRNPCFHEKSLAFNPN